MIAVRAGGFTGVGRAHAKLGKQRKQQPKGKIPGSGRYIAANGGLQSIDQGLDGLERSKSDYDIDIDELSEDSDDEHKDEFVPVHDNSLKQLVRTNNFQWFVGAIILLNTVVMSLEADNQTWPYWYIFDNCLLGFFVVELLLRLYTYGTYFFKSKQDFGWNWFDFLIVLLGVIDLWIFKPLFGQVHEKHAKVAKFVTVLRVIRILRILRLLRLLKVFKDLYLLAVGLVMSVRVVFWISILFFILIVVSAIFCTTLIGHEADQWDQPDRDKILFYFGTVPNSMKTLFQFVTLDGWADIAHTVREKEPYMQIFFVVYIIITSFTILSLMTGVVSEHILATANEDQEVMKKQHDKALRDFMESVQSLFEKADSDHGGTISRAEFKKILEDKVLHKKLLSMGIEIFDHDMLELFDCLDHTAGEELTHADFCNGFCKIRGEARAMDLLKLHGQVMKMSTRMTDLRPGAVVADGMSQSMINFNKNMDSLENHVGKMGHRMDSLEDSFNHFMAFMGKTPRTARSDSEAGSDEDSK